MNKPLSLALLAGGIVLIIFLLYRAAKPAVTSCWGTLHLSRELLDQGEHCLWSPHGRQRV